jgi:hypothetical protein
MALDDHTKLKGVTVIHRDGLSQNLLHGVIDFYQWAYLGVGGFQNISRPNVSGVFGGSRFRLTRTVNPNFEEGKVYQGFRSDWVWETGVGFSPEPTGVNVYVNGVAQPASGVAYGHYVDYPHGRVVFNAVSGIPSTDVVEADFAHRTVSFIEATDPVCRELMFDSHRIDFSDFLNAGSGNWSQLSETRRQMPVVGVELVNRDKYKGYQLGGGQWVYQDVLYHIFAEDDVTVTNLANQIANQNDKTIWLPNRALMKEDSRYPFGVDYRGVPNPSGLMYPSIVSNGEGFRWRKVAFSNSKIQDMEPVNGWLYRAVVRTTCEVIMPEI